METIIRIAEVLDVPMNKLFEEKDISDRYDNDDSVMPASNSTFSEAFRKALHVIAITNPEGKILEVNNSLLKFSGHSMNELLGLQISSANLWKDFDEFKPLIHQGLEQASYGSHFIREIHVIGHDNTEYYLHLIISPVSSRDQTSDVELIIVEAFLNEQD